MTRNATSNDHDFASPLLPWLVNATLSGAEKRKVEQHVASCDACQAEIVSLGRIADAVRNDGPVPIVPKPDVERVFNPRPEGVGGRHTSPTPSPPRSWRPSSSPASMAA